MSMDKIPESEQSNDKICANFASDVSSSGETISCATRQTSSTDTVSNPAIADETGSTYSAVATNQSSENVTESLVNSGTDISVCSNNVNNSFTSSGISSDTNLSNTSSVYSLAGENNKVKNTEDELNFRKDTRESTTDETDSMEEINKMNSPYEKAKLNASSSSEKQESIEELINRYATRKKRPSSQSTLTDSDEGQSSCLLPDRSSREKERESWPTNSSRIIRINLLTDRENDLEADMGHSHASGTAATQHSSGSSEELDTNVETSDQYHSLPGTNEIIDQLAEKEEISKSSSKIDSDSVLNDSRKTFQAKNATDTKENVSEKLENQEKPSTSDMADTLETIYEKGRVVEAENSFEVILNVKRFLHGKMSVRSKGHYVFLVEAEADDRNDPGEKVNLTKRFFIPGRVDMQRTSTSLSSEGILVISVPKLPPLKIKTSSDIATKDYEIQNASSKDRTQTKIEERNEDKTREMSPKANDLHAGAMASESDSMRRTGETEIRSESGMEDQRSRFSYETRAKNEVSEDIRSRNTKEDEEIRVRPCEEVDREWSELRSMDEKYKEWLDKKSRDEKYKDWFNTTSKDEKQRCWFDSLSRSNWDTYEDFFDKVKEAEKEMFERKERRSDHWFKSRSRDRKDEDWFDRIAKRDIEELDSDWLDSKTRSYLDEFRSRRSDKDSDSLRSRIGSDFLKNLSDREDIFGNKSKFEKDLYGSRVIDSSDYGDIDRHDKAFDSRGYKEEFSSSSESTKRANNLSESRTEKKPSCYETDVKYHKEDFSSSSSRSHTGDKDDSETIFGGRLDRQRDSELKGTDETETVRKEYRRGSDSSFDFPIVRRGRFFQDSFFDGARDDFDSVLEKFFDRKRERFGSLKEELKIFEDTDDRKERRRHKTVISEDNDSFKVEINVGDVDEQTLTVKEMAGNEILVEGRTKDGKRTFKKQIMFPFYGQADLSKATSSLLRTGQLIVAVPKTLPRSETEEHTSSETREQRNEFSYHIPEHPRVYQEETFRHKLNMSKCENVLDNGGFNPGRKTTARHCLNTGFFVKEERLFDDPIYERDGNKYFSAESRKEKDYFAERKSDRSSPPNYHIYLQGPRLGLSPSTSSLIDEILHKYLPDEDFSKHFESDRRRKMIPRDSLVDDFSFSSPFNRQRIRRMLRETTDVMSSHEKIRRRMRNRKT